MTVPVVRWWPAALLVVGAAVTLGVDGQGALPLRAPLPAVIPTVLAGFRGRDVALSEGERQVAGVTSYLVRAYVPPEGSTARAGFSLYVGYYDRQMQGRTVHSPKNCLPGAGWEPLSSSAASLAAAGGHVTVNRYLLQNGTQRALVLYWYQGRGRVAANEYAVKWDLLRDAALRHRSDEALVRIVVPVTATLEEADTLAAGVARALIPDLYRALPS